MKNLDSCSKYAHDHGLSDLVALILSLIRLTIERDWRIRDDGFEAHETYSVFPTKITIGRES